MLRCRTAEPGLREARLQTLCIHWYTEVSTFTLSQHASPGDDRSHMPACNFLHGPCCVPSRAGHISWQNCASPMHHQSV